MLYFEEEEVGESDDDDDVKKKIKKDMDFTNLTEDEIVKS